MAEPDQPIEREEEIRHLIHQALFAEGGESVEGAFVDRYVSNSDAALDELEEIFGPKGPNEAQMSLIREAIRAPDVPRNKAARILAWFRFAAKDAARELLGEKDAGLRAIGAEAAADVLEPAEWMGSIHDFDPEVRLAALEAIGRNRARVPDADELIRNLLNDPDYRVRDAAVWHLSFFGKPEAQEALLKRLESEAGAQERSTILIDTADKVRMRGVHGTGPKFVEAVGPAIKGLLVRELGNEDVRVRRAIASAMERFHEREDALAMVERLKVEKSFDVKAVLLLYTGYPAAAEEALPVLTQLMETDPEATIRTRAAFSLEYIPLAAPNLIRALDDPADATRRAAAMSLGRISPLPALPALAREYADPRNRRADREFERAIRDVVITAAHAEPKPWPSDAAPMIQRIIDGIEAPNLGDWPLKFCRDDLNAYPLHGTLVYMWALQPDGTILWIDHESFSREHEPESDTLVRFAVMVQGAKHTPELAGLIPNPPKKTEICPHCLGVGSMPEEHLGTTHCFSCRGLGWVLED